MQTRWDKDEALRRWNGTTLVRIARHRGAVENVDK